jgi:protein-S-isoprenylcysteine O-methyltransferase Ste14
VAPIVVVAWELLVNGGQLRVEPWFLPLVLWGFLQYRLVGRYRLRRGGGGPGMGTPPERLVTGGLYAWCRNPMYLGHIIFLVGLALSLRSLLAAIVAAASAVWFHVRVRRDERRLAELFGEPYAEYSARVKRWIPGLF